MLHGGATEMGLSEFDGAGGEGFGLHGFEEGGFGGDAGEEGAVAGGLFAPELEVGVVGALVARL